MRRALLVVPLLAACTPSKPAEAPPPEGGITIVGAKVWDGERFRQGNVQIVGDRIASVGSVVPKGTTIVDGKGHTVLPGLIDAHGHVGKSEEHLARSLAFGVTTVVDLFGPPGFPAALRAEDGTPKGAARAGLVGAGNLATAPKGHGTEYGIPIPTLERPDEAKAFVAARKQEGSEILKIVFDTGTKDAAGTDVGMPTLSLPTVTALVAEGRAAGLPVAVHTGGCEDLRQIAAMRPDVLAHGCAADDPEGLAKAIHASGAFFNPTLAVQLRPCGMEYWIPLVAVKDFADKLEPEERGRLGKDRKDHDTACSQKRMALVGAAAKLGVRLLAGPDSPNRRIPFGASLLAEIELLRLSGATIPQALAAATSHPADAFRLRDRGRLAPGLRADVLLVEGDVEADPTALLRTRAVFRGGVRR